MTIVKDPLTQQANRIDSKGRQIVRGWTETEGTYELDLGNAYNLNTGSINLTSANESAVAYLKNNETSDLIIVVTFVIIGASTSGTGDCLISFERNPTGGTIVDNATAGDVSANRNFGSNNTLNASFYKGAEGYTLTGAASDVLRSIVSVPARVPFAVGSLQLPKGSSIGILVTPPASNTSMNVQIAFQAYLSSVEIPS